MADKKFKRTVSDKLKKALVISTAMLALGGNEAKADNFLDKIFNGIAKVENKLQDINLDLDQKRVTVGQLRKEIEYFNINTGGAVDAVKSIIASGVAHKMVKKQAQAQQDASGTYQTTPQEFSQENYQVESSSAYLQNVQRKLNKNKTNVSFQNTQQQIKTTQRAQSRTNTQRVNGNAAQTALNILNMNANVHQ